MANNYLVHHGILGQKWGIRRFQNPDGTYTSEGKRRRREDSGSIRIGKREIPKSTIKKAAIAAATIGTVAAAAYYVKKHPETIAKVVFKASKMSMKNVSNSTISKGESYAKKVLKTVAKQAWAGAKEGIKEAPFKVAKASASGAAIIASNRLVEKIIGKKNNDRYIQAYNAYNKKNKIGQLPDSKRKKKNEVDDE